MEREVRSLDMLYPTIVWAENFHNNANVIETPLCLLGGNKSKAKLKQ